MVNNLKSGKLNTILLNPTASIVAIPMDTTSTILHFEIIPAETESIWFARMCKSGSAIEIKKPSIIPAKITIHNRLDLVRVSPI